MRILESQDSSVSSVTSHAEEERVCRPESSFSDARNPKVTELFTSGFYHSDLANSPSICWLFLTVAPLRQEILNKVRQVVVRSPHDLVSTLQQKRPSENMKQIMSPPLHTLKVLPFSPSTFCICAFHPLNMASSFVPQGLCTYYVLSPLLCFCSFRSQGDSSSDYYPSLCGPLLYYSPS